MLAAGALALLLALGAATASGLTRRAATVTSPGDSAASNPTALATCSKGQQVLFGGVRSDTSNDGLSILKLNRVGGPRNWATSDFNYGPAFELSAVAYCGEGYDDLKVRKKSVLVEAVNASTDPPTEVTSKCRKGERIAFGGVNAQFVVDNADIYLSESARAGKRGWRVAALNFGADARLTAFAYCSRSAPKAKPVSSTLTLPGSVQGLVHANCPQGSRVAYGGFRADVTPANAFVLLRTLLLRHTRTWEVEAYNTNNSNPGDLTAIAYCV